LLAGLSLVAAIVIAVVFLTGEYLDSKDYLESEVERVVNIGTTTVSEPLWTFNNKAIKLMVDNMVVHVNDHIVSAKVIQPDGRLVYEKNMMDYSVPKHRYFNKEGPIVYEGKTIGTFQITGIKQNFWSQFLKIFAITISVAVALSFVLSKVISLILKHNLETPVKSLISSMEKAQQGDYSIFAPSFDSIELQKIATVYNSALKEILRRDQKLMDYADSLEQMVDKRTAELETQKSITMQASRMAAVGQLSAGVAHEINNPLTVIDGKARKIRNLIQADIIEKNQIEDSVQKIESMVQRITRIVRGLRTFSRDGSNDPMSFFQISKFLGDINELVFSKILKGDVDFTINNTLLEDYMYGREVELSQVLINLINNAVDAVSNLNEKWIKVEIIKKAGKVYFTVEDSGGGIPRENLTKLMQPFFTTKEIGKGTGLGLSISHGIIKSHGGDLYYCNGNPHTKFEFFIPFKEKMDQNSPTSKVG
jgi:C4-dicarboxylate-specific signal transduction histidine kinase